LPKHKSENKLRYDPGPKGRDFFLPPPTPKGGVTNKKNKMTPTPKQLKTCSQAPTRVKGAVSGGICIQGYEGSFHQVAARYFFGKDSGSDPLRYLP
jgi:hypothetical protein